MPDETQTTPENTQPPETQVSDSPTPVSTSQEPEVLTTAPEASISVVDMPQGEDHNQAPIQPEPQTPEPRNQPQTSTFRDLLLRARAKIQFRKAKKLETIMSLFAKQTKITNDDVQKHLYVSDATATRYLSILEKQGKIKQNDKTGKHTFYTQII